jgi:hypothetical protein
MRNPLKNAIHALKHNRRHLVYAMLHRFSWLFPNDERYLKLYYKYIMGLPLDLENPKTFNAKQQWLKLYNRKDIYTTMADKVAVKDYVAGIIGPEYVIPTLKVWKTPGDIDFDALPDQFVLPTFVKAVRENGIPIRSARTTVSAPLFIAQAKKTMFGSLTMRTLAPLLQSGVLSTEPAYNEATTLETIESISGDFEHILDLLELNRIFPLLDKKLV